MALAPLDYIKTPSDQNISVWIGPANAIADFGAPTAAEINAMENISAALSWQDWDFGVQASETTNEPSFADPANFTDFGASQYGGSMSMFYPKNYDDPTNALSRAYDLTDQPWELLAVVIRIDGEKRNSTAAQDGDYVHAFLTMTDGEVNSLTGAEALRRTITLLQQSVFAIYTIVGSAGVAPVATPPASLAIGESVRVPATVLGREFTNALEYRSEDPEVAVVGRGGIVTGVGDGTTDITITNPNTDDSATVEVTVA